MKNNLKMNLQFFAEKESKKRYYSMYQNAETNSADIYIYGDITSWEWLDSDVSSYTLAKELQELDENIESINVFINSYGGEVAEGLAIYNALKRHKAKVTTYTDGFACSAASVIFSAGDERVMSNTSLLMIHNAWTWGSGDSNALKKQAEDLETITQASINVYMNIVNITEEEVKEMMDDETWIGGDKALELGFATKLVETEEKQVATQSVRNKLVQKITSKPKLVANINFDEDKMREIVRAQIKEQLQLSNPEPIPEPINQPLNMLKALFNNKEEK
ncbi:MAG TPA: Clp protease ClpP [Epulopiscium sp.]|nr:Clp protease ClpP [Candidatus Epulonipiscium sp.]